MALYKKKNVSSRKKKIKNAVTDNISMKKTPTRKTANKKLNDTEIIKKKDNPISSPKMKVIKGNKIKIKRRKLAGLAVFSFVIIFILIFALCTPTGLFEFFQNRVALLGNGSGYPVSLSSGGSLISVLQGNDHYISVTASSIDGYNNNGKLLFSYPHGYSHPVVKQSAERFLLCSLGENEYSVYNLNKQLFSSTTSNKILAAAIAEDGTYAIATQSDSYSSQVVIYDKNNKQIYKWMCADYIINNVAISPDGNRIAVSVFNTKSGKFLSKLYILGYKSATPINLFEYENELIMSINNAANSSFYTVFENNVTFYKWNDLKNTVYSGEKRVFFARNSKKYSLIVNGNEANNKDNEIVVFNGKGVQKNKFIFNEEIVDIALRGKYIYILGDRMIYIYNVGGELLNSIECEFGVKRIIPVGKFSVATFTDSSIKKVTV